VERFNSHKKDPFSIEGMGHVKEEFLFNEKLKNYKTFMMGLLHNQLIWISGECTLGKVLLFAWANKLFDVQYTRIPNKPE